jgi:acyl-CoA thioester hydrolase
MWEVLRSSVNTSECDQMGHMNVRHYFGRASDGLSVLLLQLGLSPRRLHEQGLGLRARDQHLRFSRELLPGAGFTVHGGIVDESATQLTTYEELRTLQDEVSATVVSECQLIELASGEPVDWPSSVLGAAPRARCTVPPYAAARGVVAHASRTRIGRDEALALGMLPGYLGPVLAQDCDARGVMREFACMGRISDGIAHFFRAVDGMRPQGVGGAALEYRFVFHAWPRVSDVIEVRSGLSALGPKTMQVTHYLFDAASGECFAGSQAVVVWFDLKARRAVTIPEDVQTRLRTRVIPGLSL